jgi:hypothetical protein
MTIFGRLEWMINQVSGTCGTHIRVSSILLEWRDEETKG